MDVGSWPRPVTLAEREGLTLLFVRRPDDNRSHAIVIATENVAERVYEAANASVFPVVHEDLTEIGNTVQALGEGLSKEELRKFFQMED